jgi:phage terminase large subunit-like protein
MVSIIGAKYAPSDIITEPLTETETVMETVMEIMNPTEQLVLEFIPREDFVMAVVLEQVEQSILTGILNRNGITRHIILKLLPTCSISLICLCISPTNSSSVKPIVVFSLHIIFS